MTAKKDVNNLAAFRAVHDDKVVLPAKIRAAFETLKAECKEAWRYEDDLLRLADVGPLSTNNLGWLREHFKAHIVETRRKPYKRCYFWNAAVAAEARGTQQ